jgi:4-diphosphocytidyl-2-C-methyl-D-erythritol kinase
LKEIIKQPVQFWKNTLKNDFEELVFVQYPQLSIIKEKLNDCGAVYASMSGSGSAIYGIFEQEFFPSPFFSKFENRGGFLFKLKYF